MSHKVVYNACYGGFSISVEAVNWLEKNAKDVSLIEFIKNTKQSTDEMYWGHIVGDHLPRHHKDLVTVVEALGIAASGNCAELEIANVGNQYRIEEYDGSEEVITPEGEDWIFIED